MHEIIISWELLLFVLRFRSSGILHKILFDKKDLNVIDKINMEALASLSCRRRMRLRRMREKGYLTEKAILLVQEHVKDFMKANESDDAERKDKYFMEENDSDHESDYESKIGDDTEDENYVA